MTIRAEPGGPGWTALQQVNDAIRFGDLKAAAVLAANGLFGGQLWVGGEPESRALLLGTGLGLLTSALLALGAIVPRCEPAGPESLHHFDHVAARYARNSQGFVTRWLATTADEEATDRMLAEHLWAANLVAHRKFSLVTWSIRLLVTALVVWAGAQLGQLILAG